MHWAKRTNRHPGEKSHGANIRGKTDYSATIRLWRRFWSKVGTPSALLFGVHALNPQWHTTWYYKEPDQTCRGRPQGYSQPLHILLRLKCDPVLFFSSLSDSVWCREVNLEGKLLSPFYSSYFFWLTRWQPSGVKMRPDGRVDWALAVLTDMESKDVLTPSAAADSKWKLVYWWSSASWWTHSGKVISAVTARIKTYNAICETQIEVTT